MEQEKIKKNLEIVILECFKKAEEKKFRDLNFSFPKNKTPKEFLKSKIKVLNNIDEYSQHFLSIHTRAKAALREFKLIKFDGHYLELLRLVLQLSDKLAGQKLKSIRVYDKNELPILNVGEEITIKPEIKIPENNSPIMKNTRLIKSGVSGKRLKQQTKSLEESIEDLNDIEL